MRTTLLLSVAAGLVVCRGVRTGSGCYSDNQQPYVFFASKTAYEFVHDENSQVTEIPGCTPAQFWMMARHGTRYPKAEKIEQLKEALPELRQDIMRNHMNDRGQLCEKDLENLKHWKLGINSTDGYMLTDTGREEHVGMARRFKGRFPSLLGRQYHEDEFQFRHTDTQRTEDSARAFVKGLWGNVPVKMPEPIPADPLIRYYKSCERWQQEVQENQVALTERDKFLRSSTVSEMITRVNDRLGYTGSIKNLTYGDIELMYDMCRFDKAWNLETMSPWCAIFSDQDLRVIEYVEDLKYYYSVGYGHRINYEQACTPVQDFISKFRNVSEGANGHQGVLYFTHTKTILSFITRLGIAQDTQQLQHDNFEDMKKRKWRSSFLDPFSANVAIVLFNCSTEYKTAFYLQEKLVQVRGCHENLCPLKSVMKEFGNIADECDLTKICASLKSRGVRLSSSFTAWLLLFPALTLYSYIL